ncbi:unnamed protein product [Nippostrongylus brasiliensis]|uniref:DUF5683 domain-containing protein n=1 Tax=Nippostrongylus brasiliensis TaxID=27835 RepID=A0A0N4YB56_NIPBR|nr:unnamed protein product [Nippostrongylus brasiliensis]
MKMIALQMFVALVVLLTSDGAKSKGKLVKTSCDIDAMFCTHMSLVDYYNERAIGDLMEQKVDRDDFKEDSQRLVKTNRELKKLLELEAESKSELVEASRTPLHMEVRSLFQLRVTCSDGRRKLIVCNETLDSVHLATYYLILAVEEDGVLSSNNCEKWPTFCEELGWAFEANRYAIGELEDSSVKDGGGFNDARERLWHTNHEIIRLLGLKGKKKSELIEASKKPLDREIGALFQLRITCYEGRRELPVCNETLESVFLATTFLVHAIMAVAEGSQLEAINATYKKFQADFTKAPWNETFGIGYTLGRNVLDVLEAEQQSKRERTRRTF